MGYWYWRPIKTDWTLNENATNRFTLPNKGHLSGLQLLLKSRCATSLYAHSNSWPSQVTNIRIIGNGNKEIIDLRNRQLQAINFWETGQMPNDTLVDTATADLRQHLTLPFGRYLGDLEYGLILEKFRAGLEFEDTNTISTAVHTDTFSKYDVYGLFRKNPEGDLFNGGFFKKRQILNRDTEGATQHSVTMPTLNKLKQIHMFIESDFSTYEMTKALREALTKIWIGIKSKQEYIVDNMDWRTFYQMMHMKYGRKAHTVMTHDIQVSAACYLDTMIYDVDTHNCQAYDVFTGGLRNVVVYKWDREERVITLRQYDAANARQAGYAIVKTTGIGYNGNVPLLMIDPLAKEDKYLDAEAEADVTVEFTEAASTENVYIVLDELQKTYPD